MFEISFFMRSARKAELPVALYARHYEGNSPTWFGKEKKNAIMRRLHGGNRGFSRVHSLRKTEALFNAGLYVPSVDGHDIIARESRGESSHEGTLRSRFASERTIPPNMMDRDDTRAVKGAREISTYTAWYGMVRPFSRHSRDMTLRANRWRCNSSNVANYRDYIGWSHVEMLRHSLTKAF